MIMDTKVLLAQAIALAAEKHKDQFDKGGMPYILHPLWVMNTLRHTNDLELMCIAVLHDIVEDTDVTIDDLHNMQFSDRVIDAILLLTKHPDQSHAQYVAGIKTNLDAIRVKVMDLRHNSDIRRLKGVTAKDVKRMEKYHHMYLELSALIV